jgi:hypothetical protein
MIDRSVAVRISMIVPVVVLMMTSVLRADDVVTHWNKVMLDAISAEHRPNHQHSHSSDCAGGRFDSVNGIRKYTSLHADIPAPKGARYLRRL